MWWYTGLVANAVVALAYLLIVVAILRPLIAAGQLRSNPLGTATAAIFFTCAVHHGGHVVHMLLPYAHVEVLQGMVVARMALDLGQTSKAVAALDASIASASHMISGLLGSGPGRDDRVLLRSEPAKLA